MLHGKSEALTIQFETANTEIAGYYFAPSTWHQGTYVLYSSLRNLSRVPDSSQTIPTLRGKDKSLTVHTHTHTSIQL
jgi:hypothetical protein